MEYNYIRVEGLGFWSAGSKSETKQAKFSLLIDQIYIFKSESFLEERRHEIVPNKFAEGESETATTRSAKKGAVRGSPQTGLTLLTFT